MGICPILSGFKMSEIDGREEVKIIEIECLKEKCIFYDQENNNCSVQNISEIFSIKKGLQILKTSIHDEIYDFKYEISSRLQEIFEKITGNISNLGILSEINQNIGNILTSINEIKEKSFTDEKMKNIFSDIFNPVNESISTLQNNLKNISVINDEIKGNLISIAEKISILESIKSSVTEIENTGKSLKDNISTFQTSIEEIKSLSGKIESSFTTFFDSVNWVKNILSDIDGKFEDVKKLLLENKDNVSNNFSELSSNFRKFIEEIMNLNNTYLKSFADNIENLRGEMAKILDGMNVFLFPLLTELKEINSENFEKIYPRIDNIGERIFELSGFLNTFSEKMRDFSESVFTFINEIKSDFKTIKEKEEIREAEEINDEGVLHFYSGNIELAISKFNEALKISQKPEILFNLASALSYKGEKEKAEEIFIKLIKEYPDYAPSFSELGMITFEKGKTEEAINLMMEGLEKEPKNQYILANIGYAYEKLNDIENALKYWKKAIEIDSSLFEVQDSINFYTERRI